jgi:hypothetical protein
MFASGLAMKQRPDAYEKYKLAHDQPRPELVAEIRARWDARRMEFLETEEQGRVAFTVVPKTFGISKFKVLLSSTQRGPDEMDRFSLNPSTKRSPKTIKRTNSE